MGKLLFPFLKQRFGRMQPLVTTIMVHATSLGVLRGELGMHLESL